MLTTPNVTSADSRPDGEPRARAEEVHDEGDRSRIEAVALTVRKRVRELRSRARARFSTMTHKVSSQPLLAMGAAIGLGYLVGRIRAARVHARS